MNLTRFISMKQFHRIFDTMVDEEVDVRAFSQCLDSFLQSHPARREMSVCGQLSSDQFRYLYGKGRETEVPLPGSVTLFGCKVGNFLTISNFSSGVDCGRDYLDMFIAQGSEAYGTSLQLLDYSEFLIVADNVSAIRNILGATIPAAGNYWAVKDGTKVIVNMYDGREKKNLTSAIVLLKM